METQEVLCEVGTKFYYTCITTFYALKGQYERLLFETLFETMDRMRSEGLRLH